MTITALDETESDGPQLYTPAMMAGLLKIPVRNIRRWHRMGLLESSKVAHKLPYFSFIQVQNAKQLATWIARGARPADIKRTLTDFGPRIENRSLTQLNLVIDGRRLLLRDDGKLLSSTGQLHLDFDSESDSIASASEDQVAVLSLQAHDEGFALAKQINAPKFEDAQQWTRDELLQMAEELEDAGQLDQAMEWYRVILAKYGMSAEICFQLAELLYRCGDNSAARERYYNAIELDEDFIEARANLGCVLAETGQTDLAIAAFQGALAKDDRYPDVHYHLARCLDEVGQNDIAVTHWTRFLHLSPQSPWADEALDRLGRL